MAPAVKAELPPWSPNAAHSSTATETPCSRAASAAHIAALPPPTTTTSYSLIAFLVSCDPSGLDWLFVAVGGATISRALHCQPTMPQPRLPHCSGFPALLALPVRAVDSGAPERDAAVDCQRRADDIIAGPRGEVDRRARRVLR